MCYPLITNDLRLKRLHSMRLNTALSVAKQRRSRTVYYQRTQSRLISYAVLALARTLSPTGVGSIVTTFKRLHSMRFHTLRRLRQHERSECIITYQRIQSRLISCVLLARYACTTGVVQYFRHFNFSNIKYFLIETLSLKT